jgi:NADPH-dependent 2,4-dienoyl-CoA reductase/sulfur reductase-like enzyme
MRGHVGSCQLKRTDNDCDIVVFEKGQYVSYASCGLPYFAAGYPIDPDDLIQRTAQQFADAGIMFGCGIR